MWIYRNEFINICDGTPAMLSDSIMNMATSDIMYVGMRVFCYSNNAKSFMHEEVKFCQNK